MTRQIIITPYSNAPYQWRAKLQEVTSKGISGFSVYGNSAAEAEAKLRERVDCEGVSAIIEHRELGRVSSREVGVGRNRKDEWVIGEQ